MHRRNAQDFGRADKRCEFRPRQEFIMEVLQIQLNRNAVDLRYTQEHSVAEVLTQIQEHHLEPGHVLSTVCIDGTLWQQEWDKELTQISVGEIHQLELSSQLPTSAAAEGIEDLQAILHLSEEHMRQACESFRHMRHVEGLLLFVEGFEHLRDAMHFMELYINFMGNCPPRARDLFTKTDQSLLEISNNLENAIHDSDWNLVADLIEYELQPRTEELTLVGLTLAERHNESALAS